MVVDSGFFSSLGTVLHTIMAVLVQAVGRGFGVGAVCPVSVTMLVLAVLLGLVLVRGCKLGLLRLLIAAGSRRQTALEDAAADAASCLQVGAVLFKGLGEVRVAGSPVSAVLVVNVLMARGSVMSRVVVTCLFALCGGGSNNAFLVAMLLIGVAALEGFGGWSNGRVIGSAAGLVVAIVGGGGVGCFQETTRSLVAVAAFGATAALIILFVISVVVVVVDVVVIVVLVCLYRLDRGPVMTRWGRTRCILSTSAVAPRAAARSHLVVALSMSLSLVS